MTEIWWEKRPQAMLVGHVAMSNVACKDGTNLGGHIDEWEQHHTVAKYAYTQEIQK